MAKRTDVARIKEKINYDEQRNLHFATNFKVKYKERDKCKKLAACTVERNKYEEFQSENLKERKKERKKALEGFRNKLQDVQNKDDQVSEGNAAKNFKHEVTFLYFADRASQYNLSN